jgi:hypothetical protein
MTTQDDNSPVLTPEVLDAITHIIEYVGFDEEDHWQQNGADENDGHVWLSIRAVRDWLGFPRE